MPPFPHDAPWTWHSAVALFLRWRLWLVMRGLFRRDMLIQQNLFLAPTRENNAADLVWLFAVACTGRILWTPETWCEKRFYNDSTHVLWKPHSWRHSLAEIPALAANLVNNRTSLSRPLRGCLLVAVWRSCGLEGMRWIPTGIYAPRNSPFDGFCSKSCTPVRLANSHVLAHFGTCGRIADRCQEGIRNANALSRRCPCSWRGVTFFLHRNHSRRKEFSNGFDLALGHPYFRHFRL